VGGELKRSYPHGEKRVRKIPKNNAFRELLIFAHESNPHAKKESEADL